MDVAWSRNRVGRGGCVRGIRRRGLGAGNDLHGWYYVGAALGPRWGRVFYTVDTPTEPGQTAGGHSEPERSAAGNQTTQRQRQELET